MRKTAFNQDWTSSVEIIVPFHDIDSLNITWHGHYFKYFEIARTALFQKINYTFEEMKKSNIMWPIVEAHIKYIRPATYGMHLTVTAAIAHYENKIKIEYVVHQSKTQEKMCKGYTIQAPVDPATKSLIYQTPDILLEKLGLTPKK